MFEKFGEMSSCREINELAENLLNEGDIQSLKVMAQENGIPEDYICRCNRTLGRCKQDILCYSHER